MQRRQSHRINIDAPGCYRTERGMQWEIRFSDLSEGGCRVIDQEASLKVGEEVTAYIAGTGPYIANVAWCSDGMAGLAFARPLPKLVFELIAASDWGAVNEVLSNPAKLPIKRPV